MSNSSHMTIGKVVDRLRPQYPDLSVSKVRYLEDEGLLVPARSSGGYRMYSEADVATLERILYLQKTRFLPLAVIKQMIEEGRLTKETASSESDLDDEIVDDDETRSRLHPIDHMPDMLGVSVSFVRQLSNAGLIELKVSPRGRSLVDGRDLPLIRTAEKLRQFGIGPKNLRQYVISTNRESAMFEQALAIYGNRGEPTDEQRAQFHSALDSLLSLTGTLRDQLLRRAVTSHFTGMEE